MEIGKRQTWLDGLVEGDEVALDFRTRGEGCKIYKIQRILSTSKRERVFQVNGMLFSCGGEHIYERDPQSVWPSDCCLEDPDSESLGYGSRITRKEDSERWHVQMTLSGLFVEGFEGIPTSKLVDMVRVLRPDYEPKWAEKSPK